MPKILVHLACLLFIIDISSAQTIDQLRVNDYQNLTKGVKNFPLVTTTPNHSNFHFWLDQRNGSSQLFAQHTNAANEQIGANFSISSPSDPVEFRNYSAVANSDTSALVAWVIYGENSRELHINQFNYYGVKKYVSDIVITLGPSAFQVNPKLLLYDNGDFAINDHPLAYLTFPNQVSSSVATINLSN
ncbi:MAG: hypothetical protein KDC49_18740, partial [Saprospiraceae bacterium]|nr:hypothetical protein [Saprospiraceae bacterium]